MNKPLFIIFLLAFLFNIIVISNDIISVKLCNDCIQPYVLGETGTPPYGGLAYDIVQEIFKRIDIEIKPMLFPWKRCIYNIQSNQYDAIIHLSKTNEREKYMIYSDSYLYDYILLYYSGKRKQPIEWQNFKDFKPYTMGIVDGYGYPDELYAAIKEYDLKVEKTITPIQNWYKILVERIDFTIIPEAIANSFFNEHTEFQGKFKTSKKTLGKIKWYLAFSKDSPAKILLPEINKTIKEMKNDGTIEKFKKKYGF